MTRPARPDPDPPGLEAKVAELAERIDQGKTDLDKKHNLAEAKVRNLLKDFDRRLKTLEDAIIPKD